jgi:hypothetical protein
MCRAISRADAAVVLELDALISIRLVWSQWSDVDTLL